MMGATGDAGTGSRQRASLRYPRSSQKA